MTPPLEMFLVDFYCGWASCILLGQFGPVEFLFKKFENTNPSPVEAYTQTYSVFHITFFFFLFIPKILTFFSHQSNQQGYLGTMGLPSNASVMDILISGLVDFYCSWASCILLGRFGPVGCLLCWLAQLASESQL